MNYDNMTDLKRCPYCGNKAQYYPESEMQASAIHCTECPLGVEETGMSYNALKTVWNGLHRLQEGK